MTVTVNGVVYNDHQHWLIERLRAMRARQLINAYPDVAMGMGYPQFIHAAEVGVASGRTSEILLREVHDLALVMVDHWRAPRDHPRRDQSWYDRACETATSRTLFACHRRQIVREPSVEAAKTLPQIMDGDQFDLVFIDACHVYESVLEDCFAWWPLVKSGGTLSGHDVDSKKDLCGIWGVRKAVEEFCAEKQLEFSVWKNIWWIDKA